LPVSFVVVVLVAELRMAHVPPVAVFLETGFNSFLDVVTFAAYTIYTHTSTMVIVVEFTTSQQQQQCCSYFLHKTRTTFVKS